MKMAAILVLLTCCASCFAQTKPAGAAVETHAMRDAYGYRDAAKQVALDVRLEDVEYGKDGEATLRFTVMNTGQGSVVLFNPGFGARAPSAGRIEMFDGEGNDIGRLDLPPLGYMYGRLDWVKLDKGQGFVGTRKVRLYPQVRRIQLIYWRWLLTPYPDNGGPTSLFHDVEGRTEIMRSNIVEVGGPTTRKGSPN